MGLASGVSFFPFDTAAPTSVFEIRLLYRTILMKYEMWMQRRIIESATVSVNGTVQKIQEIFGFSAIASVRAFET